MILRHTPFHWLTSCCYSYIKFLSVISIIQWHWTTLKSFLCCLLISFTFHNLNDNTFHRTELHSFMLKCLKYSQRHWNFFQILKNVRVTHIQLLGITLFTFSSTTMCFSLQKLFHRAEKRFQPFSVPDESKMIKSGDHKMPARVHLARRYQSFFWRPLGPPLTSFCETVLCRIASESTKYIR